MKPQPKCVGNMKIKYLSAKIKYLHWREKLAIQNYKRVKQKTREQ